MTGLVWDRFLVEVDPVSADVVHLAEPDHVPHLAQHHALGLAEDGAPVEDRLDAGVEPVEDTSVLQGRKQLVKALGLGTRLVLRRHPLNEGANQAQRLDGCAVGGPGVPGAYPPDGVGVDPLLDQPAAGVHRRLAGTDHREA